MPVAFWIALIYFASSLTDLPDLSRFDLPLDKIVHYIEFGILGFLLVRALYFGSVNPEFKKAALVTLGIALLFAASDELHQIYVPNRVVSMNDFVADCAGIVSSQLFFWYYLKLPGRNNESHR